MNTSSSRRSNTDIDDWKSGFWVGVIATLTTLGITRLVVWLLGPGLVYDVVQYAVEPALSLMHLLTVFMVLLVVWVAIFELPMRVRT